ncbi:Ankyrin repeat domain-containing protein [Plasmodiophora brassicae]
MRSEAQFAPQAHSVAAKLVAPRSTRRRSEMVRFGFAYLSALVARVFLSDRNAALIFQANDGTGIAVRVSSAAAFSPVIGDLVAAVGRIGTVPLPIDNAELQLVARFINDAPENDVPHLTEWARDNLGSMSVCQMLPAVNHLEMRSLATAVMSTCRTWGDISAMRSRVGNDALWFAVDNAPAVVRLRQTAETDVQKAIVKQLPDLVVSGGNVTFINEANWDDWGNLLHWATREQDVLLVEMLLHIRGLDVNARDFGMKATPLHRAAHLNDDVFIRLLLAAPGIDVNAPDVDCFTPLHWAVIAENASIIRLLLKAPGINVNAGDDSGETPLHKAVQEGNFAIVKVLLLEAPGINVDAVDALNQTAVDMARSEPRYQDIVALVQACTGALR